MSATKSCPRPVYRWWEDPPYRRRELTTETADAIAADILGDSYPTVEDMVGHFARHAVGIALDEAHWHLHHLEFIRSTPAKRFWFHTAVQNAELARYGVETYYRYRAARAANRAGAR
mgnify:CR=1 FL=1